MTQPNTLFLIAEWGGRYKEGNLCESRMWLLSSKDEKMKFLSLHKGKPHLAYAGGEIVGIRLATEEEIVEHQKWLRNNKKEEMGKTKGRKIIVFKPFSEWGKWKIEWPEWINNEEGKKIGHIPEDRTIAK